MAERYKEVKDFNNGTASMTLGNDSEGNHLDLGTYVLRLDYEAKNSLQAYQMARQVIVGKRALIKKGVARGVFTTTELNNNSNITDEEKLNSTCTFKVVVEDKNTGTKLANIPLKIGFGIGDDTIYDSDVSASDLKAKYDASPRLGTTFLTDNNGVATITFHVSDFFDATNVNQIRHATSIVNGADTYKHTIYVRCYGTSDRASDDNYVSAMGYVPVTIGFVPVRTETLQFGPEQNGYKVCGGGYVGVRCRLRYDFLYMDSNSNTENPNFSDLDSAKKVVKVGTLYMQYSTDNENFTTLNSSYIDIQNDSDISVSESGYVTVNPVTGLTTFYVRNNKNFDFTGTIYYKLMYKGKPGDTEGKTLRTFTVEVGPNYDSAILMDANVALYQEEEPIYMVAGSGRNIYIGVYDEGDVTNTTPLTHGTLEYEVR